MMLFILNPLHNFRHIFFWNKFENSKIMNCLHKYVGYWCIIDFEFDKETDYLKNSHSLQDLLHTCRDKEIR